VSGSPTSRRYGLAIIGTCALLGVLVLAPAGGNGDSQAAAPPKSTKIDLADLAGLRADAAKDVRPPATDHGLPPIVMSIKTSDRVVFLTIDDGITADPKVADIIRATGIPVTPFLTESVTTKSRDFFSSIRDMTGQSVQNHTISHPHMAGLTVANQVKQICPTSDDYQKWYGTRPWLFRPPYGEHSRATQQAAANCGIKFVVGWDATLPGSNLVTALDGKLSSGDIILTHWRPDLYKDLPGLLKKIKDQGFKIAALQDYLPAG